MNTKQLTEKLNERFAEELTYEPNFEIESINSVYPFGDYEVVFIRWFALRIEYREIQVIAEYSGDNPWIELQNDHLEIIFTICKAHQ